MHFILAFIFPQCWPLLLVFGVLWEIIEYISGLNERSKKKDLSIQYSTKWWAPNIADLFLNVFGMSLGLLLRKKYDTYSKTNEQNQNTKINKE
jgi:hypothetical protein